MFSNAKTCCILLFGTSGLCSVAGQNGLGLIGSSEFFFTSRCFVLSGYFKKKRIEMMKKNVSNNKKLRNPRCIEKK